MRIKQKLENAMAECGYRQVRAPGDGTVTVDDPCHEIDLELIRAIDSLADDHVARFLRALQAGQVLSLCDGDIIMGRAWTDADCEAATVGGAFFGTDQAARDKAAAIRKALKKHDLGNMYLGCREARNALTAEGITL